MEAKGLLAYSNWSCKQQSQQTHTQYLLCSVQTKRVPGCLFGERSHIDAVCLDELEKFLIMKQFSKERAVISRYSSKKKSLNIFVLQLRQAFLDPKFPQKSISIGRPTIFPLPYRNFTRTWFLFRGYVKEALHVPQFPISVPEFASEFALLPLYLQPDMREMNWNTSMVWEWQIKLPLLNRCLLLILGNKKLII